MAEIPRNSYGDSNTVNQALEEGWKRGVGHTMADGIITQAEESKLKEFRDKLALDSTSTDHLILDARLAALTVDDAETYLSELSSALHRRGRTSTKTRPY